MLARTIFLGERFHKRFLEEDDDDDDDTFHSSFQNHLVFMDSHKGGFQIEDLKLFLQIFAKGNSFVLHDRKFRIPLKLTSSQSYKQFTHVIYHSRVVIWGIFKSGTTLES